ETYTPRALHLVDYLLYEPLLHTVQYERRYRSFLRPDFATVTRIELKVVKQPLACCKLLLC
ncbi:MAG: hypothetical protein ACHP7H_00320, partial [Hyphomicrobiales bacterium]